MRKSILIFMSIFIIMSFIWADGTVRIYTGNGQWYYSDFPNPTFIPAVNVVQYLLFGNPWDRWTATSSGPPRPWEKLYEQSPLNDGFWIGMRNDGRDIVAPNYRDTLWFYSPNFVLHDNISRATIWLSSDDIIDVALLRDLTTGTTYSIPCVPVNSFTNFVRFDLTDFFRDIPDSPQGFRMEFRVRNTACCYVGMIGYMSYDYGEPRNYTYYLSGNGIRYISMPFKPTNSAATLSSLFPGIALAQYYNWQTGVWTPISIYSPLTGPLGDITRTYTFRVYYILGGNHYTTISGYPIFEQRYLDINTNNNLYFGTINCDCPPGQVGYVPFSGSEPDDMWPDKITGTTSWSYFNSSGSSPTFHTPIFDVYPRKAYYVVPHPSVSGCSGNCIPYHLDIINYECNYPSMESPGEEYYSESDESTLPLSEEPVYFEFTESDIELIRWIEDSVAPYIHIPDSAEICQRYPELCNSAGGFHKNAQPENSKPIFKVSAYPSPFNSEVSIDVNIPDNSEITIGIYNISGNLVNRLYIGELEGGNHTFIWDGRDDNGNILNSGNYLVRVSVNNRVVIHKIQFVK